MSARPKGVFCLLFDATRYGAKSPVCPIGTNAGHPVWPARAFAGLTARQPGATRRHGQRLRAPPVAETARIELTRCVSSCGSSGRRLARRPAAADRAGHRKRAQTDPPLWRAVIARHCRSCAQLGGVGQVHGAPRRGITNPLRGEGTNHRFALARQKRWTPTRRGVRFLTETRVFAVCADFSSRGEGCRAGGSAGKARPLPRANASVCSWAAW